MKNKIKNFLGNLKNPHVQLVAIPLGLETYNKLFDRVFFEKLDSVALTAHFSISYGAAKLIHDYLKKSDRLKKYGLIRRCVENPYSRLAITSAIVIGGGLSKELMYDEIFTTNDVAADLLGFGFFLKNEIKDAYNHRNTEHFMLKADRLKLPSYPKSV